MMDPAQKKLIRYAAVFVGLLLLWLIGQFVYSLMTVSSVEIITNGSVNTISIQETSPQNKSIDTKKAKGNLKIRLHQGTYVITAKNGFASAQQTITISGLGSSKKVTVNVNDQANEDGVLEVVTDLGAYATVADKNSVKFLDRNHTPAKLYQIDSSNILTAIASTVSFETISWADSSFGVGQSGSKLMAITGTTVENLSLPIAANTFTVAPNHDVYVSDGVNLYRGAGGHNLMKVFSTESSAQIRIVSASNNTVFISNKFNDSNREGQLIALHKDGSTNEIDGETYEGVWSKAGTYIALSGDTSTIYNDKLQKVTDLPISNVGALAWIDDNTLAYADGNLIWKFSVKNHESSVLATTNNGIGTVSQITPSSDGSSLYIAIQNPDTSNGFSFYLARYRFNSNVTVNPQLQKVSLALPNSPLEGCYAGYVNFTKLDITVSSSAVTQQSCAAATKSYLQTYGVDPNSVGFQQLLY